MAAILTDLYGGYNYLFHDLKDPRSAHLPLMSSPIPIVALLVLYNMFVQNWGPRIMANHKPFQLERLLIVYNLFQVIASGWIFIQGWNLGWGTGEYNFLCQPVETEDNPKTRQIVLVMYSYFCLKVIDLLDTVFFVLRKKNNQISFLHIYHHTGMVALSWSGVFWLPGGHDTFVGWVNTFVHVVMYGYYLVTALKPEYKGNIWWKKYITQLQMLQFLLLILHSLALLIMPDCGYPRFTAGVFIPQNTFMLVLFYDFYRKTYLSKGSKG